LCIRQAMARLQRCGLFRPKRSLVVIAVPMGAPAHKRKGWVHASHVDSVEIGVLVAQVIDSFDPLFQGTRLTCS